MGRWVLAAVVLGVPVCILGVAYLLARSVFPFMP